ncbi:hypothetical protein FQN57_006042 [Myotisia sp. PD_48]|nr:hypothetical protein FQN57_006042 [Myotisia sp. PD_48]
MLGSVGARHPIDAPPQLCPLTNEVAEYEKILSIRDQVFAGTHPRLKVPNNVVRKIAPRPVQTASSSFPASQASPSESSAPSQDQSQDQSRSQLSSAPQKIATPEEVPATPSADADTQAVDGQAVVTKTTSEINPIFLTKSDDLIRAESRLQRQRIERTLRDQLEQKKIDSRTKPPPQEIAPDFDVSQVLSEALEIVKPVSVNDVERTNGNLAASDSFDENSFYSSKAPDSPQNNDQTNDQSNDHRAEEYSTLRDHPMGMDEDEITIPLVEHSSAETAMDSPADRNGLTAQTCVPQVGAPTNKSAASGSGDNAQTWGDSQPHRTTPSDLIEEAEYSPPGPNASLNGRRESIHHLSAPSFAGSSNRRQSYTELSFRNQQSPTSRDIKVVRNHITSPIAPQPSRVSPLAVSKVPSVSQPRQGPKQSFQQPIELGSARTSPEGPVPPMLSRKRRRLQKQKARKREDGRSTADTRKAAEARSGAESPDIPYIKPEPISPPPFFATPPAQYPRRRLVQELPSDFDYIPQYNAVDTRRDLGGRGPIYEDRHGKTYELESPIDLNAPREVPRAVYRRPPVREDHDLRRVASLQHARQAEYINEFGEPAVDVPSRYGRAVSIAERPVVERPRYYTEGQPPSYSRRYLSRPVSPPHYRENYQEVPPESRILAPPPAPPQRRVLVDSEGNRYLEPMEESRPMPPPARYSTIEPFEEVAHRPNGRTRAMSIIDDPYRGRRYVQEMPPPEIAYRRVPSYSHNPEVGPRVYDREVPDRSSVLRSGSVQVVDFPHSSLQPAYVEEAAYPREKIVRVASVRPPPVATGRVEEVQDIRPRMQSVRPPRREVSVYLDDDGRQIQQYAPPAVERYHDGYNPAPIRDQGFYEAEGAASRAEPAEGASEVIHRMPRRY